MKKQRMLRTVSCVLAMVMLLTTLAACGGGKSGDEFVYVPKYTNVPELQFGVNTICVSGDNMYFTVNGPAHPDGTMLNQEELAEFYSAEEAGSGSQELKIVQEKYKDIIYVTYLCTMKTDGTGYKQLSDYKAPVADAENSSAQLVSMSVDAQGNIWVLENINTTIYNLPEGFDKTTGDMWEYYDHDEQSFFVKKLSSTGAEVSSIDVSSLNDGTEDYYYISHIATDDAGNLYLADSQQNVAIYSPDGKSLGVAKWDGYANGLAKLSDGKVYLSASDKEGKNYLTSVDPNSIKFGDKNSVPNQAYNVFAGGSNYDFCYNDGSSLYGYKFGAEAPTKILTWLNCDMISDGIVYCNVLDNGDVFAIANNYNNANPTCDFVTLVKTPAAEVNRKTPITLGCMYVDYSIRTKILEFNKTNDKYRIEIVDYSQYNTEEDYTAGLTKLNTEIIAGNAPDIIAMDNFSFDQYAAKGLLEDLYQFIDNDKDLPREFFIPSVLKVQETDGKLYHIGTGFSVSSIVGSADVLGKEPGWTMSELQDIIKQHPNADFPMGQNNTRESLLSMFLMSNYENYIDWNTGKCSFDSPDFKALLEFAATFPASDSIEWDKTEWLGISQLVSEGRQIMNPFYLYDFNSIQEMSAAFGNNLVFKGYPSEDRSGNAANIYGNYAITSTCKNKDGAWEFIRKLFIGDAQKEMWNGMPVSQKQFDENLAEAMKQDYDDAGNPISHGGMSDGTTMIEYYALTQAQADLIKSLVSSITRTALYDDKVMTLINDTVTPFFKGEKTVDVVASELQSRMNIYVNEQK